MKDGIITVYIPFEKFSNLVLEEAGLLETHKEDRPIEFVIGRPSIDSDGDMYINMAISDTGVHPDSWSGTLADYVEQIKNSWDDQFDL